MYSMVFYVVNAVMYAMLNATQSTMYERYYMQHYLLGYLLHKLLRKRYALPSTDRLYIPMQVIQVIAYEKSSAISVRKGDDVLGTAS